MIFTKKAGFIIFVLLFSCDININKNFDISDKSFIEKDLIAINGSINIGSECIVEGNLSSVNGNISIKEKSKIFGNINSVNGSITLDDQILVDDNINSVNGFVQLGKSNIIEGNISNINGAISVEIKSEIRGDISNISGDVELNNTLVHGDLYSNFGDIYIVDHSEIRGSLIIEDNDEIPEKLRRVNIVISDSSLIKGDLINNNRDVLVSIYIGPGSKVEGTTTDVEIVDSKEDFEDF